jgi:hypothetical protein
LQASIRQRRGRKFPGSKRSVNLPTPFRHASVTPFSHSEIRQPPSPRVFPTLSLGGMCFDAECFLQARVSP